MKLFSGILTRVFAVKKTSAPVETIKPFVVDRSSDPWFWDHFDGAAKIVLSLVPTECFGADKKVVDFGCGDGATTLGVALNVAADVIGVDLNLTFHELPELSRKNLGSRNLPSNISFRQTQIDQPLPFPDASIDLVYSWSVFEHVRDVSQILAELSRVTKRGGLLFIQIEPLFHGPYGSHLKRLVNQPWAHLLHGEEEFLKLAESVADEVPKHEQDSLYRNNSFQDLKRYLLEEYKRLNRITAAELTQLVSQRGFNILSSTLIVEDQLVPDKRLLEKYPLDLLLTNQIVLLAQKSFVA